MNILLSILICSTHTRRSTFLPAMTDRIFSLYEALPADLQGQVEILILTDNKKKMLGDKRNKLIDIAQGKYIAFVDDDDRLEDDYIKDLLTACRTDADVIAFDVSVSINGEDPKICHYSKDYGKDYNTETEYFRLPNHICCVKRDISQNVSFPNLLHGEDGIYARLLKPYLKTEHQIGKVLYHYDFSTETTETQQHINQNIRRRKTGKPPIADVVILSNAKSERLRALTQQTIDTCISGANGLPVNIIVIEQNESTRYADVRMFYKPEKFNYNRFANFGIRQGSANWILVANNDLIFTDGWLHNLLVCGEPVMSTRCPHDMRQKDIYEHIRGYVNGVHFSGWCFMISRQAWGRIEGFDEATDFWCADDCVLEQLKAAAITPVMVHDSHVKHLGSATLKTLDGKTRHALTMKQVKIFNKKYNQNKFGVEV